MTNWQPGMIITAGRLADGIDATTTETGMVAESGWQVNNFTGSKSGKHVILDFQLRRTGTDITVSNQGNFSPDQFCCTVPSGWRPTTGTINGTWDNGTAEGGFVIGTDGKVTIRTTNGELIRGDATAPTGNGTNCTFHIGFILT